MSGLESSGFAAGLAEDKHGRADKRRAVGGRVQALNCLVAASCRPPTGTDIALEMSLVATLNFSTTAVTAVQANR